MRIEEQPGQLAKRRGLRLRVYRPADGVDNTNGGVSGRHEFLTLVGFVHKSARSRPPTFEPLPPEYQSESITPDAPPMWLTKTTFGEGTYYLIPGNDDTGEPRLRPRTMGGNYAGGVDSEFAIVVGTTYLLPIHDRLPGSED